MMIDPTHFMNEARCIADVEANLECSIAEVVRFH